MTGNNHILELPGYNVGIQENQITRKTLQIYPNPATNVIVFTAEIESSGQVVIKSIQGSTVLECNLNSGLNHNIRFCIQYFSCSFDLFLVFFLLQVAPGIQKLSRAYRHVQHLLLQVHVI